MQQETVVGYIIYDSSDDTSTFNQEGDQSETVLLCCFEPIHYTFALPAQSILQRHVFTTIALDNSPGSRLKQLSLLIVITANRNNVPTYTEVANEF